MTASRAAGLQGRSPQAAQLEFSSSEDKAEVLFVEPSLQDDGRNPRLKCSECPK